ncbi:MAG: NifU family protein [Deltaproteobacteria bacterium]|nr:NifU family protein [Deltaproteobacteria bacterium]
MSSLHIDLQMVGEFTFQFTANKPLYPQGTAVFGNKEKAKGSLLAEKIFEVDKVQNITVSDNVVKVTMNHDFDDWADTPEKLENIIKEQIKSGQKLISDKVLESLPSTEEIKKKLQKILDQEVNPAVAEHGGWIKLLDVKGNTVYVEMGGGCQGCSMSLATLKQGVENAFRQAVPEIGEVLDITDHAGGKNPYYKRN